MYCYGSADVLLRQQIASLAPHNDVSTIDASSLTPLTCHTNTYQRPLSLRSAVCASRTQADLNEEQQEQLARIANQLAILAQQDMFPLDGVAIINHLMQQQDSLGCPQLADYYLTRLALTGFLQSLYTNATAITPDDIVPFANDSRHQTALVMCTQLLQPAIGNCARVAVIGSLTPDLIARAQQHDILLIPSSVESLATHEAIDLVLAYNTDPVSGLSLDHEMHTQLADRCQQHDCLCITDASWDSWSSERSFASIASPTHLITVLDIGIALGMPGLGMSVLCMAPAAKKKLSECCGDSIRNVLDRIRIQPSSATASLITFCSNIGFSAQQTFAASLIAQHQSLASQIGGSCHDAAWTIVDQATKENVRILLTNISSEAHTVFLPIGQDEGQAAIRCCLPLLESTELYKVTALLGG